MNDVELKQAYEKLGLTSGASRDEVEKRYELLLRREKQKRLRGEESDFEEVNRAYKLIVTWEDQKVVGALTEEKYGKYKGYAKQAERVDHFFSYYKWHLIGGIAAVALIIYGIFAYIEHREEQARLAALPPIDVELSFMGRFYLPADDTTTDRLEETLLSQMPGWQRVEASLLSINMAAQDMMDVAMQQKAMVELATERPDIYVMDADSFQWIAGSGGLLPLDAEAEGRWKDLLPEGAAQRSAEFVSSPDNLEPTRGEEHVYGIEVGASPLAEALPLSKTEMIIGIRIDAERADNAMALIERYLEAMEQ